MIYIGIDPGKSGAIARLFDFTGADTSLGFEIKVIETAKATDADMAAWLLVNHETNCIAVIEKVGATPQMGVTSAFTFGRSYGFLQGLLASLRIRYAFVTPQKWQKAMGCLSKGDKNITKAAAQRLYPNEKITHSVADALLLATYCRRYHHELF